MATSSVSGTTSSGTTSSTNQLDTLVNTYLQTRQPELDAMATKKADIEAKQVFYSNLRNKLSSVTSQIDKFYQVKNNGTFNSDFQTTGNKLLSAKKVTSSDETFVKATADSTAVVGPNDIRVNRLAINDSFVSKRVTKTATTGITPGTFSYHLKVMDDSGDETDSDGKRYNNVDLSFSITADDTNETALKKISNAINSKSDLHFSASYMQDTTSTGRIVFTAKNSGEDNKIDLNFLTDSATKNDQLNALLGLDNIKADRTSTNKTNSDSKYRVTDVTQLNSELTVNGIDVTRSSNSIDDLLPGVTLNLLKVHTADDSDTSVVTEIDSSKVISNITNAVESYNEVVKFLKNDKSMQRSDSAVSGLLSQLRTLVTTSITPKEPDKAGAKDEEIAPKYISDLGYKVGNDGSLTVSDTSTITDMLATDGGSDKIAYFFNSENGFMAKLYNIVDNLTEDNGLIKVRNDSFTKQIETNKTRTEELQARIDKAAESTRKQYTTMLDAYNKASSQYTSLTSLMTGTSS